MKTILTALLLLCVSVSFGQFKSDFSLYAEHAHKMELNLLMPDSVQHHSFIYPFFHQFVTKPIVEKQDVIIYSLQFIAGLADGTNQALVYHGALSKYPFWNYATSWKRKYKNYDKGDLRAAFPGAKTWSVAATDGNHLTRGVNRVSSIVSVGIAMSENKKWYQIIKKAIIASVINRLGFTLVYNYILK